MGIIREKYDYVAPAPAPGPSDWVTPASVRRSRDCGPMGLPTGDLETGKFGESIAGNLAIGPDAGDVSQDVNGKSLRRGYDYKLMRPTDDQYTREHNDAFYDSVKVDGVEGFVERNNVLDRS